MPTFEEMHRGNILTEWHVEEDTEVALDQIRWIAKEYQEKISGDRVANLTIHTVRDREYKLFVEGREFVDFDDNGVPHFFPVTREKNITFPDAIFYIFKVAEDRCTILLAVKPKDEVLPDYWNDMIEALDMRLRDVDIQFRKGDDGDDDDGDGKSEWLTSANVLKTLPLIAFVMRTLKNLTE